MNETIKSGSKFSGGRLCENFQNHRNLGEWGARDVGRRSLFVSSFFTFLPRGKMYGVARRRCREYSNERSKRYNERQQYQTWRQQQKIRSYQAKGKDKPKQNEINNETKRREKEGKRKEDKSLESRDGRRRGLRKADYHQSSNCETSKYR